MGLALHCHGELKLPNERDGRERDTKRKMELFPQALALLQALQICSLCLQNAKDLFPLAKTEEKEPTCHISENVRLAEGSHRQALAIKQGQTSHLLLGGGQVPPGGEQQWRLAGACLAPGAGVLLRLALSLCRRALPVDIFALLLAILGHSFIWTFGAKLPIYKKDTKNGD